jgi:Peptidase family M23/Transglycosylase SLT domain
MKTLTPPTTPEELAGRAARAATRAGATAIAGVLAKLAAILSPVLLVLFVVAAIFGPPPNEGPTGTLRYGVSAVALKDIPADYLRHYHDAEAKYGIDWAIVAAVGKVETDHGRLKAPGVTSGVNFLGCCGGPMQFWIAPPHPNTWDAYGVDGDGDGTKRPHDPADAIAAAGNYLKALGGEKDIRRALYGYNHAWWYVDKVEAMAERYRGKLKAGSDVALPNDIGQLAWPVRGDVVSPFGPRWGRMHQGIDIAVGAGTPVHAPAAGRVVHAGWMSGYGNFVCVAHSELLSTCSAHNSDLQVKVGDRVERREVIALSGCSGRCFGDHVHFEVHKAAAWSQTSATDPMPYLTGGR